MELLDAMDQENCAAKMYMWLNGSDTGRGDF